MRFRSVVLLTLWTLLIGPILAVPTNWNLSQSRAVQSKETAEKAIKIPNLKDLKN